MENTTKTNSVIYWNTRFANNWESRDGARQSRFFARLAVDHLPRWLVAEIKRQSLTLVDWGCAQGDGTDVWAGYIGTERVTGVDFSSIAIEQATQRYPAIRFINEDWLAGGGGNPEVFDVVFSSNTLEHFHKPHDVLRTLCRRARKAIVLVLPYREIDRLDEHFFSFLPENLPLVLSNGFRLAWSQVVDCRQLPDSLWEGYQIFLVYADPRWLDNLDLTLSDCCIDQNDSRTQIKQLNALLAERDGQIANLTQAIAERDGQIANLTQTVAERDGQIGTLSWAVAERDRKIAHLDNELALIKASRSWRITAPLRFIMRAVRCINSRYVGPARFRYSKDGLRGILLGIMGRYSKKLKSTTFAVTRVAASDLKIIDRETFRKSLGQALQAGKTIFVHLPNIDFNIALFQRPQQMALAAGRIGALSLYFTPNTMEVPGYLKIAPGVWLISDLDVLSELKGAIISVYSTAWLSDLGQLKRLARHNVIAYEYIDVIDEAISGDKVGILFQLKQLCFSGLADVVVASAKKLETEAIESVGADRVSFVPNGVDYGHYVRAQSSNLYPPKKLAAFKKKHKAVVGYFGALAPWLWYDLVNTITQERPDLGFVFIGPDYSGGVEQVVRRHNVLITGPVDYAELPQHAMIFDVGIIPFKLSEIAQTTSPLKLFEYFALGKPVVVTSDMLECTVHPEVLCAGNAEAFSRCLDVAVERSKDVEFKAKLRRRALENTWDHRARVLISAAERRLATKCDVVCPPVATAAERTGLLRGRRGLVSVVLPVYNQAIYLDEAIRGVVDQTYTNWELIIVNDGSTDNFDEVVGRYVDDPQIRVFAQPNQRLPAALNSGFAHARGEYWTWTSADNVMLPNHLERLVMELEALPWAGLVYSDYQAIDERGNPLTDPKWRKHNRPNFSAEVRLPSAVTIENFHESGDNFIGGSFMYRADVALVVGPYDEKTFGGEDYDYWLRMNLISQFAHVPEILYQYRVHENTLNAKAAELNLFTNIGNLREADTERRALLLKGGEVHQASFTPLRDIAQYDTSIFEHCFETRYSEYITPVGESNDTSGAIVIVVIDVPLREVDIGVLKSCDIIVTSQELTCFWLREQALPKTMRVFFGTREDLDLAIRHAAALRYYEKGLEARRGPIASRPIAKAIPAQAPKHVLIMMEAWAHGGLEQVVLDLATGLVRKGVEVSLGLANDRVPTELDAVATRNGLRTVAFSHNQQSFEAFLRRSDVSLVNYHYCLFGQEKATSLGVPTIYTIHNSYVWQDDAEREVRRAVLSRMTATIAVSREVASYAARWLGIDPSTNFVVPNGLSVDIIPYSDFGDSLRRLPDPKKTGQFGFLNVGSISRVKAQDLLIRAFASVGKEFVDSTLTIASAVTSGRDYRRLRRVIASEGLGGRVRILNHCSRGDIFHLMRSHHSLILPSFVEGWSITFMEAIEIGMPVLATDVGSSRDMASLSKAVLLIDPPGGAVLELDGLKLKDAVKSDNRVFVTALAEGMRTMIVDGDGMEQLAKEAAGSVSRSYSIDAMVEGYIRHFTAAKAFLRNANHQIYPNVA